MQAILVGAMLRVVVLVLLQVWVQVVGLVLEVWSQVVGLVLEVWVQVVGLVLELWVQVVGLVLEVSVQVVDLALGLALVWFLVLEVSVLLVLLLVLLGALVLLGGLVLLQVWVLLVLWVWVVDLVLMLVGQVDRCLISNPQRLCLVLRMRPQHLRHPIYLTILEELLEELPGTLLETPLAFRPLRQNQLAIQAGFRHRQFHFPLVFLLLPP